MDLINIFGVIIIVLMLLPNVVYARRFKGVENKCKNKVVNLLEQVGRYGSMFFMVFNVGIPGFGYSSVESYFLWFIATFLLLLAYWIGWFFYFKSPGLVYAMALAVIPSLIFLFTAMVQRHYLMLIFVVIFSVAHIYITYANNIQNKLGL